MARKHGLDDLLHFASTPRLKLAVTLAAVSFAICHVAVMVTAATPVGITADLDEIPRQLMHFGAVLCRFALPLGFMAAGFATRAKAARASQPKG
jgi:hypothetical protein